VAREAVYDENFARFGLSRSQELVLAAVPANCRVLDVGSAGGYLAEQLAAKGCAVTCVDLDAGSVAAARARGLDAYQLDLDRDVIDASGFDVVVLADVLEHTRDPVRVLRDCARSSCAIVSLPNIAHWTARCALARGRFPRADDGIFDRTHMQFFTLATASEMASEAGWRVGGRRFVRAPLPFERVVPPLWHLQQQAADRWPALFAFQVVMTLHSA
jgi:methionine biosynthesis protein MetW